MSTHWHGYITDKVKLRFVSCPEYYFYNSLALVFKSHLGPEVVGEY